MTSEGVEMKEKGVFEIWIPAFVMGVLVSFVTVTTMMQFGDPKPWMHQMIFACFGFLISRLMDAMRAEK